MASIVPPKKNLFFNDDKILDCVTKLKKYIFFFKIIDKYFVKYNIVQQFCVHVYPMCTCVKSTESLNQAENSDNDTKLHITYSATSHSMSSCLCCVYREGDGSKGPPINHKARRVNLIFNLPLTICASPLPFIINICPFVCL